MDDPRNSSPPPPGPHRGRRPRSLHPAMHRAHRSLRTRSVDSLGGQAVPSAVPLYQPDHRCTGTEATIRRSSALGGSGGAGVVAIVAAAGVAASTFLPWVGSTSRAWGCAPATGGRTWSGHGWGPARVPRRRCRSGRGAGSGERALRFGNGGGGRGLGHGAPRGRRSTRGRRAVPWWRRREPAVRSRRAGRLGAPARPRVCGDRGSGATC